jgi:hypothetical protein
MSRPAPGTARDVGPEPRDPTQRGHGTVVTVRSGGAGVVIRVEGRLDDVAARAILDAVRVAVTAGDAVSIELAAADGLDTDAARDLALCARLGAQLQIVRGPEPRSAE